MRILITKNGELEFKEIDSPQVKPKQLKRNYSFSSTRTTFTNKSDWNKNDTNSFNKTNNHFHQQKPSYVDINERKLTNDILNQATKITLKQPLMNISKQRKNDIICLYQEPKPIYFHSRNNKGLSVTNLPNQFSNDQSQSIQLKRILSEKAINSIKNQIKTKEEAIIKQKKISEDEFRTVYSQWNIKRNEFEHMLTKEINLDKNALINYFSKKENISFVSFNHICSSNKDQIIQLNKICQIMLNKQEESKMESDRIKEKLDRRKHSFKFASRMSVDALLKELNQTKSILEKYTKSNYSFKSQYKVLLDDIRRVYWEKSNVRRFSRKFHLSKDFIMNKTTHLQK